MVSTTYVPCPDTYGPRIKHVPLHSHSEGENAIALAAAAGLDLDQWHRDTLTAAMGTVLDTWAAPRVGILCPGENDREHITLARELYELLLFANRRIVHTADHFSTAREAQHQLSRILMESNFLRSEVKHVYTANGQQRIEMRNGSVIHYCARKTGSIRIANVDLLVLDDAEFLPDNTYRDVQPMVVHSSNPQVWMLGNAVDARSNKHGHVFTRARRRALTGDPQQCWIEYSSDDTRYDFDDPDTTRRGRLVIDPDDPTQWARANPGRRISEKAIREERQTVIEREFLTHRLGIGNWPTIDDEDTSCTSRS
ncbi:hypothetical protein [Rhodococcus qingshengii]|uniref:hypothetical protein n=1 Tax=Rhodococcus qingshengii TaxID=334542 RepID=UPI001315813E|nr:hypothetical protein [Rhodococcus qingshengii]MEA1795138.1 hypothetical protein [Rhodococcus qingshengii]